MGERPVSYADVVERLFRDFEDRHLLSVISSTVRRCDQRLTDHGGTALLELLERAARDCLARAPRTRAESADRRGR
jgi:hypothetical protein